MIIIVITGSGETLKAAYKHANGKLQNPHYMSQSIIWLVVKNGWMKREELENFVGKG